MTFSAYSQLIRNRAAEILVTYGKPMSFCQLEMEVGLSLGAFFPDGEIRPDLDYLIRIGAIKTVGIALGGDTIVGLSVLDSLSQFGE
jgi:hypothetical protein